MKKLSSTNIKKLADEVRWVIYLDRAYITREVEEELTKILHNTELCKHFRDFLKSKRCEENLYFWIEVELMKNEVVTPKEKLSDCAKHIYSKYIEDKSPLQVNIEYNYTEAIQNKIKTQNFSRDMFSDAQKAVFLLMATSCLMNFTMPIEVHSSKFACVNTRAASTFKQGNDKTSIHTIQVQSKHNFQATVC